MSLLIPKLYLFLPDHLYHLLLSDYQMTELSHLPGTLIKYLHSMSPGFPALLILSHDTGYLRLGGNN